MPTWTNLPSPPAPTGINIFPATPPPATIAVANLPNQLAPNWGGGIIPIMYDNQVLTVTAQWQKIVSCTASPDTPFSQTDSVTTGTSTTNTVTEAFSASLGVKCDLGSIGASLTQTFSQSITLSSSKTTTQQFNCTPKNGQASIIWWQLVYTYTLVGDLQIQNIPNGPTKPFTSVLTVYDPTFISTAFPSDGQLSVS